MDEITLILNSPLTEEEWDMIEDVDFEHTNSITFHTKHGREVEFVKRKKGKWIYHTDDLYPEESRMECDQCHELQTYDCDDNFCPNCGADMRGTP